MAIDEKKEIIFKASDMFGDKTLASIFTSNVENDDLAWYVDYYIQDPWKYKIQYLAETPHSTIRITNENKTDRNPNDPWKVNEFIEWFTKPDGETHSMVAIFSTSEEKFGIAYQPEKVFAFGSRALSLPSGSLWTEYMEDGIYGPLKSSMSKGYKLVAIIADPTLGTLKNYGLHEDYILSLSYLLETLS